MEINRNKWEKSPLEGGKRGVKHRNKLLFYNPKLKERARELRKNSTLAEVLLWMKLKNRTLGVQFHRQIPIDEYIVDFYCHELMLAIEIDGSSHDYDEAIKYDVRRQKRLEQLGVRFLRFDDREVKKDMPNVLRAIEGWLEEHQDDWVGVDTPVVPSRTSLPVVPKDTPVVPSRGHLFIALK